jgi:deazaflavin-dependent oxidoreductase (nitroreductase family)
MNPVLKKVMSTANRLAVFLYRRSKGRIGGSAKGRPLLLLTAPGRKTGQPRTVSVTYFEHNGSYVVAASAGGMKNDPEWIKNLSATHAAHIQIGAAEMDVKVRIAQGEERDELWRDVVTAQAPFFAGYQAKTGRTIPIALLDPAPSADPAT